MRTHTQQFKDNVCLFGRELDSVVTYTLNNEDVELGSEELNSVSYHYEGSILKSVMRQLDIDSNVDIPINTILNYQFGVKIGEDLETGSNIYDYIDFGDYIVFSSEKQEDMNSYKIVCYDKLLYSMVDYENINITYPITIRNYINAICGHLGLTFANVGETFVNYDKEIENELYLDTNGNSLGYTFRDVLDELAQVTASTICINEDGELELRYINNTADTIDEEYLKDINVNFGEMYGPVNTVVLSRSGGADKISLSIPDDLQDDEKIAIEISDNQILNSNNRDEFIGEILNELNGLQYYLNDYSSTGITYYDLCDRYSVSIGENTYSCIMLNDEINITQGLEENIFTERLEESETDYTKTDKTDRKINQAYIIVNKQNQTIESLTSEIEDFNENLNGEVSYEIFTDYNVGDEVDTGIYELVDNEYVLTEDTTYQAGKTYYIEKYIGGINNKVNELDSNLDNVINEMNNKVDVTTLSTVTQQVQNLQTTTYTKTQIQNIIRGDGYFLTTDTKYQATTTYYALIGGAYVKLIAGTDYIVGNDITTSVYEYGEVNYVRSESGKFDNNGLLIGVENESGIYTSKTIGRFNQQGVSVKQVNNDGTEQGATERLFAGYVDENDDRFGEEYAGKTIVWAEDMIIDGYTNVANKSGRFEEWTDEDNNTGPAFFLM